MGVRPELKMMARFIARGKLTSLNMRIIINNIIIIITDLSMSDSTSPSTSRHQANRLNATI